MAVLGSPRPGASTEDSPNPPAARSLPFQSAQYLAEAARSGLADPHVVALGAVLGFALLVRVIWLESLPPNVTADESENLRTVYQILAGRGPGLFGLDWTQLPALNTYVIAAFMTIGGFSISAMRLASVLLSVLALVPFYLLARRVSGPMAALIATLLLSANAWYLNFSRSGWENVWVALYALGALYCLELGLSRGRQRYFVAAGVFCALGLYGYFPGRLILPALLIYLPFALRWRSQPALKVLSGFGIMTAVALLLFVPQAITLLREGEVIGTRGEEVLVFTADTTAAGMLRAIMQKTAATLRAFLLLDPGVLVHPRYTPQGAAVLDPLTGIAYVAGLLLGIKRWRETLPWWILLGVCLFLPQIVTRGVVNGARAVPFAPALYLFVALALAEILRRPSLVPLRWALVLLVPLVVHSTLTGYFAWMKSPELAQAREPAVEIAEFADWQAQQRSEALAGRPGFNLDEWQARRPASSKRPVGTVVALPLDQIPIVPADQGASAPRRGTVTGTAGAPSGSDRMSDPHGIAADNSSNVYVTDTANARVLKFNAAGKLVDRWGGRGDAEVEFEEPFDIVVDDRDRVLVLDSICGTIQRFSSEGELQATFLSDDDTYRPRGLAIDDRGRLYVADTGRNRIIQLGPDGEVLQVWDSTENRDLDQPTDVAVDRNGFVYVTEPNARRLQKLDQDGRVVARREIAPSNTRDAAHLAITADGQIVMTDPGANRVGLLDEQLAWIATLEGDGLDWPRPVGVATTGDDQIWVVDAARGQAVRLTLGSR